VPPEARTELESWDDEEYFKKKISGGTHGNATFFFKLKFKVYLSKFNPKSSQIRQQRSSKT